jgi:Protein of unknown function (DUF4038)/Putative collagen-binding domain of a collagenase
MASLAGGDASAHGAFAAARSRKLTTPAQIDHVSAMVLPGGSPLTLMRDPSGTFSGSLTALAGPQTVEADAFLADGTQAGTGTSSTTVLKNQSVQLAIDVLDVTGGAPVPDHSPVITSLLVPANARVGDELSLASTAMDADGDPIGYGWTASPVGCGSFTDPASATTGLAANLPGTCIATLTATAKGKSDRKSKNITVAPTWVFPLQTSSDQRTLVDQAGLPFPILGRAAWGLIGASSADRTKFLDDTVAKGYTAIEVNIPAHDSRQVNAPRDGSNDLPFTTRLNGTPWDGSLTYADIAQDAPDFTSAGAGASAAYWANVDAVLADCEARGLAVFFFPAYVGFINTDQGWMHEIDANGPAKMNAYGAFIANRYKNRKNLVWMMGGDRGTSNAYSTSEAAAEQGFLDGLQSVTGQLSTQFSAEWDSDSVCTDQATFGSRCTLNGVYSFSGNVSFPARGAYDRASPIPVFLLEEPYDEEGPDGTNVNPSATQPVRRFVWWGWLSGIGGYIQGNGFIWGFNPPGAPFAPAWADHLSSAGALDMGRLNSFVRSIAWQKLVPSGLAGMKTLITFNGASPNEPTFVAAAAARDGTLLVAYLPPGNPGFIWVDLTVMSGPSRARWFDPTSGAYTAIGTVPNAPNSPFTTPGTNAGGTSDWILIVDPGP